MVKLTGFIEEWASFRLGKEGKSANPQWTQSLEARAEVASRWKAFITQNDAPSPTADETAATTAAAAAVVEAENQAVYAAGPGSTGAGQSSAAAGFVGDAAAERDQGYANSDRHSDESGETAAAIHGGSRGVSWRTEPSTSPSMRAAPSAGSIGSDDGGGLEVLPIISAEAERAAEGVHVDERGRASVDTVRRFVALTAGAPPRQPTNIEEIKLFFLGWVKPGGCNWVERKAFPVLDRYLIACILYTGIVSGAVSCSQSIFKRVCLSTCRVGVVALCSISQNVRG